MILTDVARQTWMSNELHASRESGNCSRKRGLLVGHPYPFFIIEEICRGAERLVDWRILSFSRSAIGENGNVRLAREISVCHLD